MKKLLLFFFTNITFCFSQSSFYSSEYLLVPENMSLKMNIPRDIFKLKNLTRLNQDSLRILRNTIYAMYGREFKSHDLKEYFNSQDWYEPNVNYSEMSLSSRAKKTISIIRFLEERINRDGPFEINSDNLNVFSDRYSLSYDMDKDGIREDFYFFIKKKNTVSEVLDYKNVTLVVMSDYGFIEIKLPVSDSKTERIQAVRSNNIKQLTNKLTSIWNPDYASHYYGISLVNDINHDYNFIELYVLFGCDQGYECIEGKYIYLYNKELKILDRGIISISDEGWDIELEKFEDYNR